MKRINTLRAFTLSLLLIMFASVALNAQNEGYEGDKNKEKAKTEKREKKKKSKEVEIPDEGAGGGAEDVDNKRVRISKIAEFDFVALGGKDDGADFKGYMNLRYGWGFNFNVAPNWEVAAEVFPISLGRLKFKQNDNKTRPTAIEHDKEKYTFWSMSVNGVGRRVFAYQPDGKTPKFYADAGLGINIPYRFRHVTVDKVDDGPRTKVITSRIKQKMHFTGMVRVGYSFAALKLGWRMSKIFKDDNIYPNPPAVTLGLSFMWDSKKFKAKKKEVKL